MSGSENFPLYSLENQIGLDVLKIQNPTSRLQKQQKSLDNIWNVQKRLAFEFRGTNEGKEKYILLFIGNYTAHADFHIDLFKTCYWKRLLLLLSNL